MWKRKPNVQIFSVLLGAWLGSAYSGLALDVAPNPHGAIEGAIWVSTVANLVSFYYY